MDCYVHSCLFHFKTFRATAMLLFPRFMKLKRVVKLSPLKINTAAI